MRTITKLGIAALEGLADTAWQFTHKPVLPFGVGVLETSARSALVESSNQLEWEQSYIPARRLIKSLVCCLQDGCVNPGLWGTQAMPGVCNCERNGAVRGSATE